MISTSSDSASADGQLTVDPIEHEMQVGATGPAGSDYGSTAARNGRRDAEATSDLSNRTHGTCPRVSRAATNDLCLYGGGTSNACVQRVNYHIKNEKNVSQHAQYRVH